MSERARAVIRRLDRLELEAEQRDWARWASELTPKEKRNISDGIYHAFRRPFEPEFTAGTWLRVKDKLHVRIADVQLHKGDYRCRIDKVRDNRSNRIYMPHYREDVEMATTLDVRAAANPPEPEGVDREWLDRFAEDAAVARAASDRERTEQNLGDIKELPARDRMAALHKLASDRGVDVRDDVKAFERRVLRRLGKAA